MNKVTHLVATLILMAQIEARADDLPHATNRVDTAAIARGLALLFAAVAVLL